MTRAVMIEMNANLCPGQKRTVGGRGKGKERKVLSVEMRKEVICGEVKYHNNDDREHYLICGETQLNKLLFLLLYIQATEQLLTVCFKKHTF